MKHCPLYRKVLTTATLTLASISLSAHSASQDRSIALLDLPFMPTPAMTQTWLNRGLDRLIWESSKLDFSAFSKTENKYDFKPPQGCSLARVYNHKGQKSELKMVHPAYLKLASRVMLRSACASSSDSLNVLARNPNDSEAGDILSVKKYQPGEMSPAAQSAMLTFSLGLQESNANLFAGWHAAGGVQTLEAGAFQNAPTMAYSSGYHDEEGGALMKAMMLRYHEALSKVFQDQKTIQEYFAKNPSKSPLAGTELRLEHMYIVGEPKVAFKRICDTADFDDPSYWDANKDVFNSSNSFFNALTKDAIRVRAREVKHETDALESVMRDIVKGKSALTYSQVAFEQLQAQNEKCRDGFQYLKYNPKKITEDYLAGKVDDHETEGLRLSKCIRAMNFFCPAFAADSAAMMLRLNYEQYGPAKRFELRPTCQTYFNNLDEDFKIVSGSDPTTSPYCRLLSGEYDARL